MKRILIFLIKFYQTFISPILRSVFGEGCRFYPTCSQYTLWALENFDLKTAIKLSLTRILSCHSFFDKSVG